MSTLTARAAIAQKFALMELEASFQDYLEEHAEAVDAEGNQVVCLFAPDEPAREMMLEAARYPHPVLVASDVDNQLMVVQFGDFSVAAPSVENETVVRVAGDQSVLEVMREFKAFAAANGGQVTGLVFEFSLSGDRVLVTA